MNKRIITVCTVLVVVTLSVAGYFIYKSRTTNNENSTNNQTSVAKEAKSYTLELQGNQKYEPNVSSQLKFSVQDQNGNTEKKFDTTQESELHLVILRKDRTNFQHLHPDFNQATGVFEVSSLTFPTDGEYRVFADFTPSSADKDFAGLKKTYAPFQDIQAGDIAKYTPVPLGSDKLTASSNGIESELATLEGDGGETQFFANTILNIGLDVTQDNAPYTNLQPYFGSLGHLFAFGPDLEFVHAHPLVEGSTNQTGQIVFQATFPKSGQYKVFTQTQANNQVSTTGYTVTTKDLPGRNQ
ncbi:MAG TPA: hypothetical protein PKA02_02075 [Candidatus Saccharibacteria bacterium]|nr:hypothetical protein [Candidatus Saccharibacteria bacterium]